MLRLLFEAAERVYGIDTRASIHWTGMMADFEAAQMSSIQEVALNEVALTSFQIEGCHMHYCSAIMKNIRQNGLTAAYKDEDSGLCKFVSRLFAIAFVPPVMISAVYFDIKSNLDFNMQMDPNMVDFFKYYEKQWIQIL